MDELVSTEKRRPESDNGEASKVTGSERRNTTARRDTTYDDEADELERRAQSRYLFFFLFLKY